MKMEGVEECEKQKVLLQVMALLSGFNNVG